MLRNTLPDVALPWLDAAIVLTADKLAFPPLLGSGGNDGNLDFSTNFIQRLVDLFELESGDPGAMAGHWLDESLQGGAGFGLVVDLAIGQFNPGAVGGPNATTGFEAASLVNPWDYVLLVEGAVLFAAAATRRLESAGMSAFSYPFTVFSASGGSGSIALSDASSARSEMWLPLWEQPADYRALQALLSEGRAMVGRRPARDGLDMARAIAGLGVDRGIRAFHRYGFLKRSGKSHLAAPLSRFHVQRNPRADLIVDLDRHGWLGNLRRLARQQETPSRLSQQAVRLENALFAATQVTAPEPLQATLIALGKLQLYLARSPKYWQKIQPVPTLRSDWITLADDGSHEFRLAAALASLSQPPLREYLFPVTEEAWNAETRRAVWAERQLSANLVAVLARRLLEADRSGAADKPLGGGLGADQAAVAAFLRGAVNDARLSALVVGLALARTPRSLEKRKSAVDHLPGAYAVFKPLFVPDGLLHRFGVLPRDRKLPIPPGLIARLASGDVNAALRQARQRARGSSIPMLGAMVPDGTPLDGARLAAALMVPIEAKLLRRLLDRAYPGKISETESTTTKSQ
jgi:CRISPR-associated protein Csx17